LFDKVEVKLLSVLIASPQPSPHGEGVKAFVKTYFT